MNEAQFYGQTLSLEHGIFVKFGAAKPGYPNGVILATFSMIDENGATVDLGEQHLSSEFLEVAPETAKYMLNDSAQSLLRRVAS